MPVAVVCPETLKAIVAPAGKIGVVVSYVLAIRYGVTCCLHVCGLQTSAAAMKYRKKILKWTLCGCWRESSHGNAPVVFVLVRNLYLAYYPSAYMIRERMADAAE